MSNNPIEVIAIDPAGNVMVRINDAWFMADEVAEAISAILEGF